MADTIMRERRRFKIGDGVILTQLFGTAFERPYEVAEVVGEVYGSLYQYIVQHGDKRSFVQDEWLQARNFTISEEPDWVDLAGVR